MPNSDDLEVRVLSGSEKHSSKVRALLSGYIGDSPRGLRHQILILVFGCSNHSSPANALVAQVVEHVTFNHGVPSSSLGRRTSIICGDGRVADCGGLENRRV